ncbi:MAG: radical SAM protein [Dehalococcoidia bacterium]|nr:radical SAM protein [Dehalococcoidia bacterium]
MSDPSDVGMLQCYGKEHMLPPGYIALYDSGELQRRSQALEKRLSSCDICPRRCHVNRLEGERGVCRSGSLAAVSAVCDHYGEEPPISGTKGSGAIFFAGCNLRCVFCQNHQISQPLLLTQHDEEDAATLAQHMLHLQDNLGCHNINLVSPSHFVPQIAQALVEAVPLGLHIPLVYNSNAYDSLATLRALEGIVDVYLPDLKYASDFYAKRFSRAQHYVNYSQVAIVEMYRQVGNLVVDENGLARSGLIVRHLILPHRIASSRKSLFWLTRSISPEVTVSIMSQYHPCHKALAVPLLCRRITAAEYLEVTDLLANLCMENGWVQDMDSPETYLPDFDREDHPFAPV